MTRTARYPADRAPSSLAAIGIAFAITFALVFLAGRAEAAQSVTSGRMAAADLCSAARSVASNLSQSTSLTQQVAASPASLKAIYLKLQAAEPSLLASSSGSLKTDLTQVFGFLNTLVADLKKANWKATALAPQFVTLEAQAVKVKKPLNALESYFKNTCKINT